MLANIKKVNRLWKQLAENKIAIIKKASKIEFENKRTPIEITVNKVTFLILHWFDLIKTFWVDQFRVYFKLSNGGK